MSGDDYWVRLQHDGRVLGAGFFVTSRWVLTAAHCLSSIPPDAGVVTAYGDWHGSTELRIVERNSKVDIALLQYDADASRPDIPEADRCAGGARWSSPYRPSDTEPSLAGTVTDHAHGYRTEGGDEITALQLRTDTELGDYSGYSGSPVETDPPGERRALVGILLEQYPDRVDPRRSSNVLFAGTIGEALGSFPQFDVGHLLNVLTGTDRSATRRPVPDGPSIDAVVSRGDAKLEFLERCAKRGYLDAAELRIMRLKVINGVIDTDLT